MANGVVLRLTGEDGGHTEVHLLRLSGRMDSSDSDDGGEGSDGESLTGEQLDRLNVDLRVLAQALDRNPGGGPGGGGGASPRSEEKAEGGGGGGGEALGFRSLLRAVEHLKGVCYGAPEFISSIGSA